MDKYVIVGGKKLRGRTEVSGAKNVALKALVAACMTDEEVVIENVPLISDVHIMIDIIRELGGKVAMDGHTVRVRMGQFVGHAIPLDAAAEVRTSAMFLSPLLARVGKAQIPNPGGCRLGARPIDRSIDGIKQLGVRVSYHSDDGFFYAETQGLIGTTIRFEKNSHTATETLLLASTLADGQTILENAAEEPEVDELIALLCDMGAKIKRTASRTIEIHGVTHLHGGSMRVKPDRNEVVTLAIAAAITDGDITIIDIETEHIQAFLNEFESVGGGVVAKDQGIRFFRKHGLSPSHITTAPHPGFMTDWQGPWAVLMTQANGESTIHETVFENRFGYVDELHKMGANIASFNPAVSDPEALYNFNLTDDREEHFHAITMRGPVKLHNGVVTISDIRAGATLVLAALAASGTSTVLGVEKLDRGYEQLERRLANLGAEIKRVEI